MIFVWIMLNQLNASTILNIMLIKIDFRETDLHCSMTKLMSSYENIKLETENLPIGDIIICDDDGTEKIIIERKTLNDLAASIRDGRYVEQSFRLNNTALHNHNIFYLLEGDIHIYKSSKYGRPVTKEALLSAMTTITYTKGFSIYRSADLAESAIWILQTADKINRINEPNYYASDSTATASIDYLDVSKRVKKENITPENIGAIMLAQIPNVSTASAHAIMNSYASIDSLIVALKNDYNVIDGIAITTKTGKSRRISKTCIANVFKYLVGEIK